MNFKKFTIKEGEGLFLHCKRQRGEMFHYGNLKIDTNRSFLNNVMTTLPKAQDGGHVSLPGDYYDAINKYLAESKRVTGRKVSKNAKCVVGVVVTMPEQYGPQNGMSFEEWYTEDQIKKENDFYRKVVLFLLKKFGHYEQKLGPNFLCAAVHRDETTSHCHVMFIPVVKSTYKYDRHIKKGLPETRTVTVRRGSISAAGVVNIHVLRSFHEELDSFLKENVAWYKGGILLAPEERMMPGQNLDLRSLKKTDKDYARRRAKENRIVIMAEAPHVFDSAFEALMSDMKDKNEMISYIELVSHLVADGKLTEADCQNDPVYQRAYVHLKSFKKLIKEQRQNLMDDVEGTRNHRTR